MCERRIEDQGVGKTYNISLKSAMVYETDTNTCTCLDTIDRIGCDGNEDAEIDARRHKAGNNKERNIKRDGGSERNIK